MVHYKQYGRGKELKEKSTVFRLITKSKIIRYIFLHKRAQKLAQNEYKNKKYK